MYNVSKQGKANEGTQSRQLTSKNSNPRSLSAVNIMYMYMYTVHVSIQVVEDELIKFHMETIVEVHMYTIHCTCTMYTVRMYRCMFHSVHVYTCTFHFVL